MSRETDVPMQEIAPFSAEERDTIRQKRNDAFWKDLESRQLSPEEEALWYQYEKTIAENTVTYEKAHNDAHDIAEKRGRGAYFTKELPKDLVQTLDELKEEGNEIPRTLFKDHPLLLKAIGAETTVLSADGNKALELRTNLTWIDGQSYRSYLSAHHKTLAIRHRNLGEPGKEDLTILPYDSRHAMLEPDAEYRSGRIQTGTEYWKGHSGIIHSDPVYHYPQNIFMFLHDEVDALAKAHYGSNDPEEKLIVHVADQMTLEASRKWSSIKEENTPVMLKGEEIAKIAAKIVQASEQDVRALSEEARREAGEYFRKNYVYDKWPHDLPLPKTEEVVENILKNLMAKARHQEGVQKHRAKGYVERMLVEREKQSTTGIVDQPYQSSEQMLANLVNAPSGPLPNAAKTAELVEYHFTRRRKEIKTSYGKQLDYFRNDANEKFEAYKLLSDDEKSKYGRNYSDTQALKKLFDERIAAENSTEVVR